MLSLWMEEGDKFGLHSSLLAQLKTVVLELHVGVFISSWIQRLWPSTFHLWSSELSFLASVMKVFCARPMHSTSQFNKTVLSKRVCVCTVITNGSVLYTRMYNSYEAGGPSMCCVRWSNEAATVHADITVDHRDVPAFD